MAGFDPFCPANRLRARPLGWDPWARSVRSAGPAGSGSSGWIWIGRLGRSSRTSGGGAKKKIERIYFFMYFIYFFSPPPSPLPLQEPLHRPVPGPCPGALRLPLALPPSICSYISVCCKILLGRRAEEFWYLWNNKKKHWQWRTHGKYFWQICKEKAKEDKDRNTKN